MAASLWVVAGIATALALSIRAFLQKKLVSDMSGLDLSFVSSLYTAVLLLPLTAFYLSRGIAVSVEVWLTIIFVGAANATGLVLFFKALELEDLSIASPLRQTLPLFAAVLEPLFLATGYSLSILAGAFMAAGGSYFLMFEGSDLVKPLTRLRKPGPLMAVGSAFFLASGSIAVKYVVSNVPIGFFLSVVFWFITGAIGIAVHFRSDIDLRDYTGHEFVYLGIITALSQALIFYTIDLSSASEATILFRLSTLFNVLIGFRMFNEENIFYRLVGTLLIIAGIAFIVI